MAEKDYGRKMYHLRAICDFPSSYELSHRCRTPSPTDATSLAAANEASEENRIDLHFRHRVDVSLIEVFQTWFASLHLAASAPSQSFACRA